MSTSTNSIETSQRRHLYLPTRVSSDSSTMTATTSNVHWESQPVVTWMSSLMNQEMNNSEFSAPVNVPTRQVERYQHLVEHCRARSNHAVFWNEYQTIQSLHQFLMNNINSQWPLPCPEYPLAVERLYHETSDRLEALLLSPSSVESSTATKVDMSVYMTAWLRENWINPYPDDIILSEMAAHCGTTPTVVSNWLINARTRKWRPAIAKAMELNRPAKHLLEDSLCFFDGRPIRPLSASEQIAAASAHKQSLIADEDDWKFDIQDIDNGNDDDSLQWMNQKEQKQSNKRRRGY
ncbi:hypothetical protein FisN_32Hh034 [Fistulifera solaris]|uniref:KN homeodomain domain-containing protein n=1 Tax=Fistulifera solaris TaxID=1519565 RepID=A0A1Z5K3J4_FISSO|nr:hypothetical protein FisN_32Hh034 [Fistulifera solaris]|eukprot:GAX20651.1 hypothetical protein FisN_32Hh034 [Fistulifera solaris]